MLHSFHKHPDYPLVEGMPRYTVPSPSTPPSLPSSHQLHPTWFAPHPASPRGVCSPFPLWIGIWTLLSRVSAANKRAPLARAGRHTCAKRAFRDPRVQASRSSLERRLFFAAETRKEL